MTFKTSFGKIPLALLLLAGFSMTAFAADPAKTAPASAMAKDDKMMGADDHMKPRDDMMAGMSKTDKAKMADCMRMKPAAAKKNRKCAKMMAMHPEGHM